MPSMEFRAVNGVAEIADALCDALRATSGHWGLTGGGTGIDVLAHLRSRAHEIPWDNWNIWWGDERFLPQRDPMRNDVQADDALLSHAQIAPHTIHRWLAPELADDNPEVSARAYSRALHELAPHGMDLLLLGVGPDGHVASIFPPVVDDPATTTDSTIAVRDSPKPPPVRTSLTLREICRAREIWLFTLGKPEIATILRSRADRTLPAAWVSAREKTIVWTDTANDSKV